MKNVNVCACMLVVQILVSSSVARFTKMTCSQFICSFRLSRVHKLWLLAGRLSMVNRMQMWICQVFSYVLFSLLVCACYCGTCTVV